MTTQPTGDQLVPEVDYPRPLPTVNQTASVPRRIRAMLNQQDCG